MLELWKLGCRCHDGRERAGAEFGELHQQCGAVRSVRWDFLHGINLLYSNFSRMAFNEAGADTSRVS